jgi:hypothetical protein
MLAAIPGVRSSKLTEESIEALSLLETAIVNVMPLSPASRFTSLSKSNSRTTFSPAKTILWFVYVEVPTSIGVDSSGFLLLLPE